MDELLCPEVIGRDKEFSELAERVDDAVRGRGCLTVLVGEAGVGKSRLTRQAAALAADRGLRVLTGRCVPGGSPVPFRPLAEALLVASRGAPLPDSPQLAGFGPQLARLLPDWGSGPAVAPAAEASPVLVGEAVVRLLRVLGGDSGCLLVLEDLHWADLETLAVTEYLADTLATERVLCLATGRPSRGLPMSGLLERVRRRDGAVRTLAPLSGEDCARMVAICLSAASTPADVASFVVDHCDGLPFLVEELLAGLVASGSLVRSGGRWAATCSLTPTVPTSLAESVLSRLSGLDPSAKRVLAAAAVLGRHFDWELLPGVAEVDGAAVIGALRRAVDIQLLAVDGQRFRFRHALTREAVLSELLPPERASLSARALTVIERAYPGLPDAWCELAGELAEAAGAFAHASTLATESARRALARGALNTAELTAQRAAQLAPNESACEVDAQEVLVQALALAGKPTRARAVGQALLPRLEEGTTRRLDLLLTMVRSAIAEGNVDAAAADLKQARASAEADAGEVRARVDAVAAHVALARDDVSEAQRLATVAAATAARLGLPETECEALQVLGRVTEDWATAVMRVEQAAEVAKRHGLKTWQLRALHELALALAVTGDLRRLEDVRRMAAESGAFMTVAQMDLLRADLALGWFDHEACLESAQRCVEASRRYGLASLPVALLWLAGAHALGGREAEMQAALAEAIGPGPGDPRVVADAWGRVRATWFALQGDRAGLQDALECSMQYTRIAPKTGSVYPGQMPWAMLRAMSDDDYGQAARAEVSGGWFWRTSIGRPTLALVDAVILGRQGRRAEATQQVNAIEESLTRPGARAWAWSWYLLRLAAEAALRDGWGDPTGWLREAEAYFAAGGHEGVVRECRSLLRDAGSPQTRRGRGESDVPPALRKVGITSRELDVLRLVGEGCSTREIAQRLVLSPRTVEHHVSRLLTRTGLAARTELVAFWRANRVPVSR